MISGLDALPLFLLGDLLSMLIFGPCFYQKKKLHNHTDNYADHQLSSDQFIIYLIRLV